MTISMTSLRILAYATGWQVVTFTGDTHTALEERSPVNFGCMEFGPL